MVCQRRGIADNCWEGWNQTPKIVGWIPSQICGGRHVLIRKMRRKWVETNLLLVQTSHLLNVLLGSLLETALSLSGVELVGEHFQWSL